MIRKNLLDDVVWGVFYGALFAIVLCCFVVVAYLIQGPQSLEAKGTTLGTVLVMYLVGGFVAGTVIGLLRPLTNRRWGAALVGAITAMPLAVVFRIGVEGLQHWRRSDTITIFLFALILGAPLGWIYWGMSRSPHER